MTSKILNFIIRLAGLLITTLLIIQPWLIKVDSTDPFLISGWVQILASSVAIFVSSLLLAFYRPIKAYFSLTNPLLVCFIAIVISLFFSHYTSSLRVSLLAIGLLSIVGSLRLFRKSIDNYSVAGMISLTGFFMAVYSICQFYGHDFLIWQSKYNVVGTLTNPNFLGLFICLTSTITFGLFSELYTKSKKDSFIFLFFLLTQIVVLIILNKSGLWLTLIFISLIWIWSKWFCISGRISRISPVLVGLIMAIILLLTQWKIYAETSNYPWEKITKVPNSAQAFVSRLILWEMGFSIFKEHIYTGTGAGSISYIMPLKRPNTASSLGLKIYNDDPHSFIISTLAETGFLGLWGICSLIITIFGAFTRKNFKYESVEIIKTKKNNTQDEQNTEDLTIIKFPWYFTSVAVVILYLSFQCGYINQNYLPIAISLLILLFGVSTSIINKNFVETKNDYFYLSKSTLATIFAFAFYSLFNNSFSILPLVGFLIPVISLHFSCCKTDVKYKPRITIISLLFIALPLIYALTAIHFQLLHQIEESFLAKALVFLNTNNYEKAEQSFLSAIETNPQCLRGYHGLAISLESQGKIEEAQDALNQLDTMVPNMYNAKYEIARILFENNKIREAHVYAVKNLEWASDAISYELLGRILCLEGRIDEAEQTFKEGLISYPLNMNEKLAADRIRLNLSALAIEKGDYKSSKNYISQIKTDVINNIDALYINGLILSHEKKYNEALAIFEKALKIYPNVPRLLNAIGYILTITNQNLDRAQILLERAFDILKNNNKINNLLDYLMVANSLGKLYQKQNKIEQARELLKLSYEETPNELKKLKEERLKDLNDFYNSFGNAQ